ncbi:hypothetical protein [Nocardioides sp.]|uniref:hypothetical protein n=1 Tax=Nocardioides sp. TaxID=35761 RepID=UPI002603F25B|nr:hypothetical protein [Nocardioides sp.]
MADLGPTSDYLIAQWEVRTMTARLDHLSDDLLRRAARHQLAEAAVTATYALSPGSATAALAALGFATVGPTGLIAQAVALRATAAALISAQQLMLAADDAVAAGLPLAESVAGAAIQALDAGAPGRALLGTYAGTEGVPSLALTGTVRGETGPHRLSDLLLRLDTVNRMPDGTIQIQAITGADGRRRFVVYLPGTDAFDRGAVRSWPANASIRLGAPTTYEAGIVEAMTAAGVGPRDPVLLVGHSQGGMVAAEMARHRGPFTISQVVTAGSPIGDRPPPPTTGLIALEHTGDPVPGLDGTPGRSTPGARGSAPQTTLRFGDGLTTPLAAHGLGHYVAGARTAEESTDPSVRRAVAGVREFLGGRSDETTTWVISRAAA